MARLTAFAILDCRNPALVTGRTVEVFHRGRWVAAHARRFGGVRHDTDPEHMPSTHRRYAE